MTEAESPRQKVARRMVHTLEMYCWLPGKQRNDKEEKLVPWRFAGWRLSKTGPKIVYILKLDGEDLLHFHVETEALVTTPRSTLRKYHVR